MVKDVEYEQVWKCTGCGQKYEFPKEAWESWTEEQRQFYLDELKRGHLVHSEE